MARKQQQSSIRGAQSAALTAAQVEPSPREKALTAECEQLRNRVESLKQETGQAEVILSAILDAAQRIEPIGVTYVPPRKTTKVSHPCEAVLVLTDWHVGKTVSAAEVLGENDFSLARRRGRRPGRPVRRVDPAGRETLRTRLIEGPVSDRAAAKLLGCSRAVAQRVLDEIREEVAA